MAIDTTDKKLSIMEWCSVWEPGLMTDETAGFDQGDKQHLLWGYSGISWATARTRVAMNPKLVSVGRLMSRV